MFVQCCIEEVKSKIVILLFAWNPHQTIFQTIDWMKTYLKHIDWKLRLVVDKMNCCGEIFESNISPKVNCTIRRWTCNKNWLSRKASGETSDDMLFRLFKVVGSALVFFLRKYKKNPPLLVLKLNKCYSVLTSPNFNFAVQPYCTYLLYEWEFLSNDRFENWFRDQTKKY